ncbi:hypothetical protein ACWDBP_34690 [Streptomyces sp. NPDC001233]
MHSNVLHLLCYFAVYVAQDVGRQWRPVGDGPGAMNPKREGIDFMNLGPVSRI